MLCFLWIEYNRVCINEDYSFLILLVSCVTISL